MPGLPLAAVLCDLGWYLYWIWGLHPLLLREGEPEAEAIRPHQDTEPAQGSGQPHL